MMEDNVQAGTGAEGQGQPPQLSDFELSAGLRPAGELSRDEARAELAKMGTGDPKHPLWDNFSIHHKSAVDRRLALIDRLRPSEKEVKAAEADSKAALDKRVSEIQEKNAEEDARAAADRCEQRLQTVWGADYKGNLASLQKFVQERLTDTAKDLLETPDPRTGVALGDNPDFITDLHALMKKYGAAGGDDK